MRLVAVAVVRLDAILYFLAVAMQMGWDSRAFAVVPHGSELFQWVVARLCKLRPHNQRKTTAEEHVRQ